VGGLGGQLEAVVEPAGAAGVGVGRGAGARARRSGLLLEAVEPGEAAGGHGLDGALDGDQPLDLGAEAGRGGVLGSVGVDLVEALLDGGEGVVGEGLGVER